MPGRCAVVPRGPTSMPQGPEATPPAHHPSGRGAPVDPSVRRSPYHPRFDEVVLGHGEQDHPAGALDPDHPRAGAGQRGQRPRRDPDDHQQRGHPEREDEEVDEAKDRAPRGRDPGENGGERGRAARRRDHARRRAEEEDCRIRATPQPPRPGRQPPGRRNRDHVQEGEPEEQQQVGDREERPPVRRDRAEQRPGKPGEEPERRIEEREPRDVRQRQPDHPPARRPFPGARSGARDQPRRDRDHRIDARRQARQDASPEERRDGEERAPVQQLAHARYGQEVEERHALKTARDSPRLTPPIYGAPPADATHATPTPLQPFREKWSPTVRAATRRSRRRRGAQRKSQTVDIEDSRLHGGSMRYGWVVVLASIALALPNGAHAQRASGGRVATMGSPVKRVAARAVLAEPPRLDGVLDDAAWQAAEPATDFVQMRPVPGAPSTRPTEARVVYDASAIYVGMRMYDHPDSVVSQLARRDASGVYTDWAHVLIDSYHDRRTAFRFSVTPRGTKKDVLHFDDSNEDLNWDAVWEVAVAIDSLGWTAEFRIPLSQLRFSRNDGGDLVWGINFGREIARNGESAWWSPVRPDVGGFVSHAGELYGLAGLGAARRLEVMPYAVAGLTHAPGDAGNPFYEANAPLGNVGVDLRYGITSNLTLSATINPDFGQVEADASVVNLTAYETFYPEKRPFFTEGSNFFEFKV